jgi:cytochrome c oxidase subunit II
MWMVITLLAIICGSLLFHFVSPWWTTALASNWRQMDDTLAITVAITSVFFVVINLFVVYCLLRFRHRAGHRAAYEPENKRLERWLIGVTTLGIAALLAPGLSVYASYVNPPADALVLEVVPAMPALSAAPIRSGWIPMTWPRAPTSSSPATRSICR